LKFVNEVVFVAFSDAFVDERDRLFGDDFGNFFVQFGDVNDAAFVAFGNHGAVNFVQQHHGKQVSAHQSEQGYFGFVLFL
jgi:hypothetical protein